ncbi:MAG: acyltransferase [Pseudomonadales bacterium]
MIGKLKFLLSKGYIKIRGWTRALIADLAASVESSEGFGGVLLYLKESDGQVCVDILKQYGASIEKGVRMDTGLTIHNADGNFRNLKIGSDCHIGKDVFIDLADEVLIGNRVTISMRTLILTHVDPGSSSLRTTRLVPYKKRLVINDDAYIGAGVILLPGVEIGEGSIVGAGAVVTKSVPENSTAKGVPAK